MARARTRKLNPDFIPFALYVETATGSADNARSFLRAYLNAWRGAVSDQRRRYETEPELMRREAVATARARGARTALPRRVRVSFDDRVLAITHVVASMFNLELTPDEHTDGQFQLERVLGIRSGRGGAIRDVSALAVDPRRAVSDPDTLLQAASKHPTITSNVSAGTWSSGSSGSRRSDRCSSMCLARLRVLRWSTSSARSTIP